MEFINKDGKTIDINQFNNSWNRIVYMPAGTGMSYATIITSFENNVKKNVNNQVETAKKSPKQKTNHFTDSFLNKKF